MKTFFSTLILLIGTSAFSYGGGSSIGPANPAAVNCIKLEGKLERVLTPRGEDANCVLDEWYLYSEMLKRGLTKEHTYPIGGMPNPAAINCIDINGTLRIEETPAGQKGLCVVAQWTLFRIIDVTKEAE